MNCRICEIHEKNLCFDCPEKDKVSENVDDRTHKEEEHPQTVMENRHALVEACLCMVMTPKWDKSDINHNHGLDQLVDQ